MAKKISPRRWFLIFLTSIILGILLFPLAVKFIFRPDFSQLLEVSWTLFVNIGSPYLKLKAYVAFFVMICPFILCTIAWLAHKNVELEDYGDASFADLNNKETWQKMDINQEKGLMLGCLIKKSALSNKEERTYIRATKPLACLVVAPPGTGKTASIALPNLYSLPNSVFVLDIKGELYEKSAGYRAKNFNNKILLFSPFSDENTMFFNPFDKEVIKNYNFSQMKKLADQIAGTIFMGEKGKENDHWIVSAKTMFSFFAMYQMQKYGYSSLPELAEAPKKDYYDELEGDFLRLCQIEDENSGEYVRDFKQDTFKAFMRQITQDESIDSTVRNQANAYVSAAEQEFASIKSTYDTFMKVFSNPQVANATSKMSFDYEDLREQKISVYVVIQTADMDILAPLVRILVESVFKNLMMKENADPNKFIYFILDEFVRFGKMPFLLEAPALCRSYGLVPIYITQSYEQIKKYYGDDDLKIIKANVGYQVVFRMNSPEDAKVLSEMIGKFTRKKLSRSKGNLDILKHNDSVSSEGYELVTVQDILSNPLDQIYILIGGFFKNPIKAKVNFWFKNPAWNGADKIPYNPEEHKEDEKPEENKEENPAQEEKEEEKATQESQETPKEKEKPKIIENNGFKTQTSFRRFETTEDLKNMYQKKNKNS